MKLERAQEGQSFQENDSCRSRWRQTLIRSYTLNLPVGTLVEGVVALWGSKDFIKVAKAVHAVDILQTGDKLEDRRYLDGVDALDSQHRLEPLAHMLTILSAQKKGKLRNKGKLHSLAGDSCVRKLLHR